MRSKTPYIVIGIVFVLFNIIAFAIPTDKSIGFWIAYAFTVIAFVIQAFMWYLSISKKKDLKSKLLGASIPYIGVVYLVIQLIAFLILMFIPSVPTWIIILVCALILGISAIFMIGTNAGKEMVTATENKIAAKRQFIKNLQIDVEMLVETETDSNIKQQLTELAKKIRLSDPMSDDSLNDLEEELSSMVAAIENCSDKASAISEAETLLIKRNKKVKALKG